MTDRLLSVKAELFIERLKVILTSTSIPSLPRFPRSDNHSVSILNGP